MNLDWSTIGVPSTSNSFNEDNILLQTGKPMAVGVLKPDRDPLSVQGLMFNNSLNILVVTKISECVPVQVLLYLYLHILPDFFGTLVGRDCARYSKPSL